MKQELLDTICEQLMEYKARFNNASITTAESICKVKNDLLTMFQEVCINFGLDMPQIFEKSFNHFYISITDGFEELIADCYIDTATYRKVYIDVQFREK